MHYAPSEREVAMVNEAFPTRATGIKTGIKLSETEQKAQKQETPANRNARN